MRHLFSMFPDGAPGAGLLLLRLAPAPALWELAAAPPWLAWPMLALALLLALGLLTPLASALYAVCLCVALAATPTHVPMLLLAVLDALAVLLLGPGAYAIDAWLFGRRVLRLPRDPRAP